MSPVIAHAKADAIVPALIQAATRGGVFLSQAGPRMFLCLLQAGHHLWSSRSVSETTKATRWVALDTGCYTGMELACMPPIEGLDVPALGREPSRFRARAIRHGRLGHMDKGLGDGSLHGHRGIGLCRIGL